LKHEYVLSVVFKGKLTHHLMNRDSDGIFVTNRKVSQAAPYLGRVITCHYLSFVVIRCHSLSFVDLGTLSFVVIR
jgi:hypothetical protein